MAVDPVKEYARFYTEWEKELRAALRQASRDAGKVVAASGVTTLRGARQQIALRAINDVLNGVGQTTLQSLLSGQSDAARLAASVVSDQELQLFKSLGMSASDAAYYARAEQLRAVAALETAARRVSQTKIPLSTQVYRTTALQKGMVDRAITAGLARGLSAQQLAKQVRTMINPDTAGGVSFASKRLARTEINNAYHATAKAQMKAKPWVQQVEWRLSGSHPRTDICNEYAESDWTTEDVPDKPHPQCLCYIIPVLPSDQQFLNGLFDGDYDTYLDDVMGRSGYTQEFINSSRFTEVMSRSPAVPQPGPNGERPVSKSKDPLVRQKVADLSDEQYVRWMNDTRPVAKKMADPRYATDVRTAPPVPETPTPTPTPGTGAGSITTNKNGIRAMEDRWMENLKSERGKIGWRVEDGKIVWDDADGLAKATKAAQRVLSDARLDVADTALSESARKAAQGVLNSAQKIVDDLERAATGETPAVTTSIKPKPTAIDDLRTRVEGGTSYSDGWKIDGSKVTWETEEGRMNLLRLSEDIRDINLDNARDDFLSAAERNRAKAHAKNMQELIDEIKKMAPAPTDGLDPIPDFLDSYMRDLIYLVRKGETLTINQERTLDLAYDMWVREIGVLPRGWGRIPTSVRQDLVDYWREQFDIRVLGKKVNWPLDDPTEEIARRYNVLKEIIDDPDIAPSSYGRLYTSQGQAMSKVQDVVDDIYDQFQVGQLGGTHVKMVRQSEFRDTHTLADAHSLTNEVRIGTNMFEQSTGSQTWSQKSGWWVKVDDDIDLVRQVVTHEYGHITDYGLTFAERGEALARIARALDIKPPKPGKYGFDHITIDKWIKRNKEVITKGVSQYGSTNGREIMAELFCEILCNSFPRAAAQAYKDYLIEIGVLKP